MASVCFYFQVHQPFRLQKFNFFDINKEKNYFDDEKNSEICLKVAKKCYLPANQLMLDLINKYEGRFKISYSISGVALEQFEKYAPEVLESFQRLAKTGCVEFLGETYHHSLSFLYSKEEFHQQVEMHRNKVKELLNYEPKVFRNTELIYCNDIAREVKNMGYDAILAEGADHILGWRSPNYIYQPKGVEGLKLLLKNYKLSDDIAFRFSNQGWAEWPLNTDKYVSWLNQVNGDGYVINLFMDYETFGEHQWAETGIFEFMHHLPEQFLSHQDNTFKTLSESINSYPVAGEVDMPHPVSWADMERDLSAWLGNRIQHNAINELYALEAEVKNSGDEKLLHDWRRLTTSDHFYYMCTKWFSDGDVHKYFNPHASPYEIFIIFMNVLEDVRKRLVKYSAEKEDVKFGMLKIENKEKEEVPESNFSPVLITSND